MVIREKVKWYLFKIPIKDYEKRVGAIRDFKTVRFMRMYMTGFRKSTVLRFGTLNWFVVIGVLIRRIYQILLFRQSLMDRSSYLL